MLHKKGESCEEYFTCAVIRTDAVGDDTLQLAYMIKDKEKVILSVAKKGIEPGIG